MGDFDPLGGLFGAIGSIYGAQKQSSTQEAINTQNELFQEATNQQNIAEQEKFAQNSINWKVQDAKNAGISPLAALGASTTSFSNQVAPSGTAPQIGNLYSSAGQSLGRAVSALQTPEEKAMSTAATALQLEKTQAEIDYTRSMTTKNYAPGTAAAPTFNGAEVKPAVEHSALPGTGDVVDAGVNAPSVRLYPNVRGGLTPYPSPDMQTPMFDPTSQHQWNFENRWLPMLGREYYPAPMQGGDYRFDPVLGSYEKSRMPRPGEWGYWLDRNKWFGDTFQW